MKQAYPLSWPVGYKRNTHRIDSRFKQSMERAQWEVVNELKRLGARDVVISTNLRTRNDGGMYAADLAKLIDDPGVAIYFKWKNRDISMCCDRYRRVWENIYALAMGIYSLRGMDRWGVSDFLDRAFSGFAALPEKASPTTWFSVLELSENATEQEIKDQFRKLSKLYHPDVPGTGNAERFVQIKHAYDDAMSQFQHA